MLSIYTTGFNLSFQSRDHSSPNRSSMCCQLHHMPGTEINSLEVIDYWRGHRDSLWGGSQGTGELRDLPKDTRLGRQSWTQEPRLLPTNKTEWYCLGSRSGHLSYPPVRSSPLFHLRHAQTMDQRSNMTFRTTNPSLRRILWLVQSSYIKGFYSVPLKGLCTQEKPYK